MRARTSPSGVVPPTSRPRLLLAFPYLVIVTLILALGAGVGAFVSAGGGGAVSCPSYPSCLFDQAHLAAALHTGLAAVLGVVMLVLLLIALLLRRIAPSLTHPTIVGFVLLVVMGSLGAGFATGQVSFAFVSLQVVLWISLVIVLGWLLGRSLRLVQNHEPAAAESAPDAPPA